jgi:hypothetical protein
VVDFLAFSRIHTAGRCVHREAACQAFRHVFQTGRFGSLLRWEFGLLGSHQRLKAYQMGQSTQFLDAQTMSSNFSWFWRV